jgi:PAS domain S-box-containing protein
MSWVDLSWPMISAASLTLGFIHLLAWLDQRSRREHLMFSLAAGAVGVLALIELARMRADTIAQCAQLIRWQQVVLAVLTVALVGMVRERFQAGSGALGAAAIGLRALAMFPNFLVGENLNFLRITELLQVPAGGGALVTVPTGIISPWMLLGQASNLALLLYICSAMAQVWRRPDHSERSAVLWVGGALIVFVLVGGARALLFAFGNNPIPVGSAPLFAGVLFAVSREIGAAMNRARTVGSALQHSESKLRESRQRMHLVASATDIGLWNWDLDSNEVWFTEPGRLLLGLEPGQHMSVDLLVERVHPDDRAAITRARDRAVAGDGDFECESRLLLPDGRVRWLTAVGRVQEPVPGEPRLICGAIIDITERRQAEERFRLVVEASPVAMLVLDDSGRISLANNQTCRTFGYRAAEMAGLHINQLIPTLVLPGGDAGKDHVGGSRGGQFALRFRGAGSILGAVKRDASELLVEIQLTPINMGGGPFFLACVTDVSARLSAERDAALERDELAHLSRVALLGELSGSLAHELNQPLTAILSNAQASLRFLDHDQPDLHEVRDSLVGVVDNVKRASEVIRRLRAMLRKERMEFAPLDLNEVVAESLRLLHSDILARQVVLEFEPELGAPVVTGDRVQLQQVLLNIVLNACDAMSTVKGPRQLDVRVRLLPAEAVEVSIVDTGPGIALADLDRIFVPFVTTKPDGIGLGLPICNTITRAHGGRLWASNNPVRGATFHLVLPLMVPAQEGQHKGTEALDAR